MNMRNTAIKIAFGAAALLGAEGCNNPERADEAKVAASSAFTTLALPTITKDENFERALHDDKNISSIDRRLLTDVGLFLDILSPERLIEGKEDDRPTLGFESVATQVTFIANGSLSSGGHIPVTMNISDMEGNEIASMTCEASGLLFLRAMHKLSESRQNAKDAAGECLTRLSKLSSVDILMSQVDQKLDPPQSWSDSKLDSKATACNGEFNGHKITLIQTYVGMAFGKPVDSYKAELKNLTSGMRTTFSEHEDQDMIRAAYNKASLLCPEKKR